MSALLAASLLALATLASADNLAVQVWSSFGKDPLTSLTFSFASEGACSTPVVRYGLSPAALTSTFAAAPDAPFDFSNSGGLAFYYRARLTGLAPGTRYFYQVSACGSWSGTFSTSTLPEGSHFKVLLTGDMGRDEGEQILPQLLQEAELAVQGDPSAASMFVIAGDYAYDMHDNAGARGASFMQRLSNVSAFIPTVMTIGNHEQSTGNASHFTNILGKGLPSDTFGHYYSFDTGLIHWVMLSSEVYHMAAFNITLPSGPFTISAPAQRAWLEADLAAVDRAATPWVITVTHRPMYCSNADGDECASIPLLWPSNPLRLDLEPLLMAHGVDLCVEAHEHSVEIIYPLVNGTVTAKDFVAPRAPVHYVTGTAGCNEDSELCQNPILLPSDFTHDYLWGLQQYSYTRLWAYNASVLHMEQVKVLPTPSIWRAIDIVQPNHGPFV